MKCAHGTEIANPSQCDACKSEVKEIATLLAQEKYGEAIVAMNGGGGRAAARLAAGEGKRHAFTYADYNKTLKAYVARVPGVTRAVLDEVGRGMPQAPDAWGIRKQEGDADLRTAAPSYVGRGMPVADDSDDSDVAAVNQPNPWAVAR